MIFWLLKTILNIGKEIVEAHGGTVGAENVLDMGAVFYFTLPFRPSTLTFVLKVVKGASD